MKIISNLDSEQWSVTKVDLTNMLRFMPLQSGFQPEMLSVARLFLLFSFLMPVLPGMTQNTTCNFPISCYDTGNPGDYQVIDDPNMESVKVSDLLAMPNPVLLDQNSAIFQPQRVEIRVSLEIDIPYTFAPGSELVFSRNIAGMEVTSDLTITQTHLHGVI